jgi:hypothetical protein
MLAMRAPTMEQRDVFRAGVILLAAEGRSTRSIAGTVDTMPRSLSLWRGRFTREGLAGLIDKSTWLPPEVQCRDPPTHPGCIGAFAASWVRALDRAADCG